ncbi:MAG: hypothetical protein ACQJCO_06090 [cyanobacterium endosymbiont of Rhopalodia sterrenbergii]
MISHAMGMTAIVGCKNVTNIIKTCHKIIICCSKKNEFRVY